MRVESLQVGAVGVEIEVQITEFVNAVGAEAPVDLSTAQELRVELKRPDDTKITKTGLLTTDGLDGKMFIRTAVGDISIEGTYYVQGFVSALGWEGYSTIGKFEVHENL